jgi:hypothetical protein
MSDFLDKLERRFGRYAIPGLINYILGFNLLTWILGLINDRFVTFLHLDFSAILQGQVWRLFTFWMPFDIGTGGLLWAVFVFFFIYLFLLMGNSLEREWGTFRFNVFYFTGLLGTLLAALIGKITMGFPEQTVGTDFFVNLSIFYAFATVFPKFELRLFLIIPVQVRWLALFSVALLGFAFLILPLPLKLALLVAMGNYILFFAPVLADHMKHRREVGRRRQEFKSKSMPKDEALHRCARCNRTEADDPELDFRVSADDQEYCVPCLEEMRGEKEASSSG